MWHSKDFLQKDLEILKGHSIAYKAYLNLIPGEVNKLSLLIYRARKRAGSETQRFFKKGTRWAISHAPGLMYKYALKENADLYAAHLECAFFAGRNLVRAGKKVSFDFEDWYSHDYLVPGRPVKLLQSLERFALHNGLFCTAASESMAAALCKFYQAKTNITVVYNGFSIKEQNPSAPIAHKIDTANGNLKLLWFSRTAGPGRGIEFILKALKEYEQPVELHLLGDMIKGFREFLSAEFKSLKKHSLVIHPFMPHEQLHSFISQFQTGLAIEENINDNKKLTISNKILQYLQAGISVLASDTEGQREVGKYFPGRVLIVDIEKPRQINTALNSLRNTSNENAAHEQKNFKSIFSWEAQEEKLKELVEKYL